ncbi:MAG: hypothetical protein WC272_07215 [Sulfurimonas sp.]|jgi:hypothetical protein
MELTGVPFTKERLEELLYGWEDDWSHLPQVDIAVVAFFEHKNSYPIELFYTQSFPTLFFVSSKDELYLKEPLRGSFTKDDVLKDL